MTTFRSTLVKGYLHQDLVSAVNQRQAKLRLAIGKVRDLSDALAIDVERLDYHLEKDLPNKQEVWDELGSLARWIRKNFDEDSEPKIKAVLEEISSRCDPLREDCQSTSDLL